MPNTPYQRKFRSAAPVPQREMPRRKRFALMKTLLMLVGAATLLVLLMRHVIVPVLVLLPQWLGGAA